MYLKQEVGISNINQSSSFQLRNLILYKYYRKNVKIFAFYARLSWCPGNE